MTIPPKILVVEDDQHIALALKIRLCAAGYDVSMVSDTASALSTVAELSPNVAICDYNLPDGNGLELMKNINAMQLDGHIVFIFLTASQVEGLREQALANGAYAFIDKPFSSQELLHAVNSGLTIAKP